MVVRVHYSRQGTSAVDDEVYRGRDTGVNWSSGNDETQSALNQALSHALDEIDTSIVQRCASLNRPPSP